MLNGHFASLVKLVFEITIGLLVAVVTYNANRVTNGLESAIARIQRNEVAIAELNSEVRSLSKAVDRHTMLIDRAYDEIGRAKLK